MTATHTPWYRDASVLGALALLALLYAAPIAWLFDYWMNNLDHSIGILAPLFSAWLLWMRRGLLASLPVTHNTSGFGLIVPGLLLHVAGLVSGEYLLSGLALPMLLHGGSLWLEGKQRASVMAFPFWFLLFAFPFFDTIEIYLSFPMRLASTIFAQGLLAPFMEVTRSGTELLTPNIDVAVIASCSGLNYLSTLLMLGVVFAWLTEDRGSGRFILIALTPLIVLVANGLRIATVAVLGYVYGRETALGFFHDFSGLLVFALAIVLLFLAGILVHRMLPAPEGLETKARPRSDADLPSH
ncbi:MAG: exosortase/archaeosortase family protein [Gammaproteobacteria bacterium]|nr:exosortase/archaeosortase family protein [Gammaproteobacteria bacterium]MCP5136667.1 exosortase/archaeosortase family protein [Gammaproteobacteria bacterium]